MGDGALENPLQDRPEDRVRREYALERIGKESTRAVGAVTLDIGHLHTTDIESHLNCDIPL